ncbi:ribosome maturation factor RimM [uncultured Abyssibacter sp.]|uniref:ribosome maturation factor RimM n=1 Tax=uncultured Abyssibacter sp. TaxID=2320202 RepID=UPI0032B2523E
MAEQWVVLGEIIGVHGVRGGLTIRSYTDPLDNIFDYKRWQLDERREVKVLNGGWVGKRMVVQLAEHGRPLTDRDQAAALIGARICVPRSALPKTDELYWADLVGLAVETTDGRPLGEVVNMMETGANDVMVVRGDEERLIPFVREHVVHDVDLTARRVVVDWDPDFV